MQLLNIAVFFLFSKGNKYYSYGTIYTTQNTVELYGDKLDGFVFCLDPEFSYFVRIHDPKYYLMSQRPLVFPEIFKQYEAKASSTYINNWDFDIFNCHCKEKSINLSIKAQDIIQFILKIIIVFSRESDSTTVNVRPSVCQESKPPISIKSIISPYHHPQHLTIHHR